MKTSGSVLRRYKADKVVLLCQAPSTRCALLDSQKACTITLCTNTHRRVLKVHYFRFRLMSKSGAVVRDYKDATVDPRPWQLPYRLSGRHHQRRHGKRRSLSQPVAGHVQFKIRSKNKLIVIGNFREITGHDGVKYASSNCIVRADPGFVATAQFLLACQKMRHQCIRMAVT